MLKINGENDVGNRLHSNGRYTGSEFLTRRFIPRLNEANEKDLLNDEGNNFSPEKISKVFLISSILFLIIATLHHFI